MTLTLEELTPFWEEFRRDFRPFVFSILGSNHIDDIFSETYCDVAMLLPRYTHVSKTMLFAWMRQILRYRCHKAWTASGQLLEHELLLDPLEMQKLEEKLPVVGVNPTDPGVLIMLDDQAPDWRDKARGWINEHLPAERRDFLTKVLDGHSIEAIAETYDIKIASARQRLLRLLRHIEEMTAPAGPAPRFA